MAVSKSVFVVASFTLALFAAIQIGDTARPPHKAPICTNTTVTVASLANANVSELQRNLVKAIWTKALSGPYPAKTKDYARLIIDLIDYIDSPSVRAALYAQATVVSGLLPDSEDAPGLCAYAAYINATVSNAQSHGKNCHAVVETFTTAVGLTSDICTLITVGALCDKCKNLPTVPRLDSKCFRRGRAYEIHAALDLFGRNIPCKIQNAILDLYDSPEYGDNIVANALIYVIPDELAGVFELHPVNILIETLNIVVEDTNPHCCHERLKRLDVLCGLHSSTGTDSLNHIVADLCHENEDK